MATLRQEVLLFLVQGRKPEERRRTCWNESFWIGVSEILYNNRVAYTVRFKVLKSMRIAQREYVSHTERKLAAHIPAKIP